MAKRTPPHRIDTVITPDTEDFEVFMADLLYAGYSQWLTYKGAGCLRPSLPCPYEEGPWPCSTHRKRRAKQPVPLRAAMGWIEWKRILTPALRRFWERYTERDGQWRHPTKRNVQDRVHAMIEKVLAAYDPTQREGLKQHQIAEWVAQRSEIEFNAVKKYTRQWCLLRRRAAGLPLTARDRAFLKRYPLLKQKYGHQP